MDQLSVQTELLLRVESILFCQTIHYKVRLALQRRQNSANPGSHDLQRQVHQKRLAGGFGAALPAVIWLHAWRMGVRGCSVTGQKCALHRDSDTTRLMLQ